MSIINEIREELISLSDLKIKEFSAKLITAIPKDSIIGIKTGVLKVLAKKYISNKEIDAFLSDLPHKYFEENQLHSFLISNIKDYNKSIEYINKFLPFIDNWATCDQLCPKIFDKNKDKLINDIDIWLSSKNTYEIRFGIKMLMSHYLTSEYKEEYSIRVSNIISDDYYINMMIAWYFATALAKQYDSVIKIIEAKTLSSFIQNKTISKARDSFRITKEQKIYLHTLRK